MVRFRLWLIVCVGPVSAALQPTTVNVTLASGTPVYGNTLNFRAQVNASLGSITFIVDGVPAQPSVVDANSGASTALFFQAGTHTVGATFSASDLYQPSTATPLPVVVAQAPTLVGLFATTAQIGQPVTLTATVAVAGHAVPIGGTVTFTPAPQCAAVPLVNGVAVCTATFGVTGPISVSAAFSGDANTSSGTASLTVTVGKAIPSFYFTSAPLNPIWGTPVTLSALVLGSNTLGAPTGTVAFSSSGKTVATVPVGSDGHAALSSVWAVGASSVTAVYSGDAYYQASPPLALNLTVGKAPVTLAVSADPAQVNQPVNLYASATLAAGTGALTGTIDFSINGKAVTGCTGMTISGGAASCKTSFPQTGAVTLGASFSGDANTSPATASAAVTVGKAAPSIYLAQSPATPASGQPVTVACLVMGAANLAAPTGTVTFSSGGNPLATQPVGSDGRASFSQTWGPGSSTISAIYNGDANYQASAPANLTLSIGKASVVFAVSSDPAQVNQPVTLRASVSYASGTSGTIAGIVDFSINGKAVAGCTGVAVSAGAASCQTTCPQLGTFTLVGSFSGDANTSPATASVSVTVGRAVPTAYLAQSPAVTVFGQTLTIDALILGATGLPAPTGTVAFSEGARSLATQPVAADGHASFQPALTAGAHAITAVYSGDANYQSVPSSPLGVNVAQAATATSMVGLAGGPFTASVTVIAPGAGLPTGTVQFRSGSTLAGAAPLVGQGTTFTAVLASSNATGVITAAYLGDANFAPSTAGPVTVSPLQSIVTVTSDHNPSSAGQPVNFTVAVSVSPQPMAGSPTGSVTLSADGSSLGTATLANGQASLSATLSVGSHTIATRYSGDASCPAATSTLVQVVGPAATSPLTISSSQPVSVFGQPVNLTALVTASSGAVQFTENGSALGSAPITAGAASLSVNLPVGVHTIAASWAGDGTSAAATGQVIQTVNQAATAISLGISGNALLAAVTVATPGAGSPGGTVRFLDAATATALATVSLNGAVATAPLPSNADTVVAIYSGDANFLASTSAAFHLLAATNAASYLSGSFAAEELVTLFGPNLSGATSAKVTDNTGTARPASLLFVSATQATIVMPAGVSPGPATVSIASPARTLSAPVVVSAVAPGLFTADGSGRGAPAAQIITMNPDGTPGDPQPATAPIDLSGGAVYLVLYGTGIRHAATAPVCTIAGQPVQVLYAGAQGSMAGLDQVNLLIPAALAGSGAVTLNLTVDGTSANPVTLSIR